MNCEAIVQACKPIFFDINALPLDEKVECLNQLREMLHVFSPFSTEPVDFVRWVKNPLVHSNDYNPNSVAPPEMELLRLSIAADGYTQPIVSMASDAGGHPIDHISDSMGRVAIDMIVLCAMLDIDLAKSLETAFNKISAKPADTSNVVLLKRDDKL